MPITLAPEIKKQVVASLRRYCVEALDMEAGDLKVDLLLDFFLKEIAPTVYNGAISDAQTYLRDRVGDLEGACYEPEFAYWAKPTRRSR